MPEFELKFIVEASTLTDAVIDALGGHTPWKETTLETNAARNVIEAMRKNGVKIELWDNIRGMFARREPAKAKG